MLSIPFFVPPCLPTLRPVPPAGADWIHEPKFDGWRIQILKAGKSVRLFSRSGHDLTRRLPALANAALQLPARSCVLDGELVLPRSDGSCDFDGLSSAIGRGGSDLCIWAFDVLHLNGRDLRPLALLQRKARLAEITDMTSGPIVASATFEDGATLLKIADKHGLEGVVSKRADRPYVSGPCTHWIKSKSPPWREANRERWKHFTKKSS